MTSTLRMGGILNKPETSVSITRAWEAHMVELLISHEQLCVAQWDHWLVCSGLKI